jgi:hypothetical protein
MAYRKPKNSNGSFQSKKVKKYLQNVKKNYTDLHFCKNFFVILFL